MKYKHNGIYSLYLNVKLHGKWFRIRANIEVISGLSGDADYAELLHSLQESKVSKETAVHLVHGDADALEGMRTHLLQHTKMPVKVAGYRDVLQIT